MGYSKEEQKKNRRKLVKALRSGKYKQTSFRLFENGAYCCLGFACQLFSEDVGGKYVKDGDFYRFVYGQEQSGNCLIPSVRDYFGFNMSCGQLLFESCHKSLTSLNDHGKTFEEIADIIEKEPEGLCITS